MLDSSDQKHRCGGEVELFLSRPYALPDLPVSFCFHAERREYIQVPLRTADVGERHAAGNVLHHVKVLADVLIPDSFFR